MSSLSIAWNWFLLATVFAFPQLLALLLYFRLARAPRWVAVSIGILAPAVFFVFLAPVLLFAGIREAQARGQGGCGMLAMGVILLMYAGIVVQLALGVMTQVFLATRRRRKVYANQP